MCATRCSYSLFVSLSCTIVHSLNHSIDWLPVILCTHPSINHYETIDFSFSRSIFSMIFVHVPCFFFCAALHPTLYHSLLNGISDAFIDYDDDNDDAAATAADNNIDGKFIFRFHWNNTHFSLHRHRQNAFFTIILKQVDLLWLMRLQPSVAFKRKTRFSFFFHFISKRQCKCHQPPEPL